MDNIQGYNNQKLKYNDKAFDRSLSLKSEPLRMNESRPKKSESIEIDKKNNVVNVHGLFPARKNHQESNIDIESYLIHGKNTYINKKNFTIDLDKDNLEKKYRNFGIASADTRKSLDTSNYVRNGYKGYGRGIGDQEISSKLRYGSDSRKQKKLARSTDVSDLRFHKLFYNFQNSDNNVLPFPRGGIDTRNLDKYRNDK
jgi:hypothetical protein